MKRNQLLNNNNDLPLYRQLIELLPEVVLVLDTELNIVHLNTRGKNFFHLESFTGNSEPCYRLMGEDSPCFHCPAVTTRNSLQPAEATFYFRQKDIHAHIYSLPVRDDTGKLTHIIEIIKDLNAVTGTQEEIEISRNRYQAIFEHSTHGIAVYLPIDDGEDFIFKEFNREAERITRVSAQEVIGKKLLEKFPNMKKFGLVDALNRALETGRTVEMPPAFYRDDIREGWRKNLIYSLPTGEVVALFQDVTPQVKNEMELKDARDSAEKANRIKSEFLANMSHELRTPLNGILGILQLLEDSPLSDDQKELINTALHSGEALTMLLSDILDLSKIEADKLEIKPESFNMKKLTSSFPAIFSGNIKANNITFTIECDDLHEAVMGDPARIRQILINLLGNAIKFTSNGTVSLRCWTEEVQGLMYLYLQVEDTGIGIPQEKIDSIFESFTQIDGSYVRKHEGSGLGLAIVKRLVDLMDGSISVKSSLGKGSVFTCTLPTSFSEKIKPSERDSFDSTVSPEALKGLHILVVEDNNVNSMFIRRVLEKEGCNVTVAENGSNALDTLEQEQFHCILMDIQMPVMDGVEATARIRSMGKLYSSIPIIALTAHALKDDREKLLRAGMNDYLSKPVTRKMLFEAIERNIKLVT